MDSLWYYFSHLGQSKKNILENYSDDGSVDFLEIDLDYPDELHDLLKRLSFRNWKIKSNKRNAIWLSNIND